jgi:alpha-amylase/alpha-mannosidase (GH57 family)
MTIYWAPLLHIYQPPTQDTNILKSINKECYEPLLTILNEYDFAKFTLNINAVLIELLIENELFSTLHLLKNLVSESKLEITGNAKYHPILPLIPRKEAYHQIQINEDLIRREFGSAWQRKGFFPPEMAISPKIAKYVQELGYKWIIQSGVAFPGDRYKINWPLDLIYCTPTGLQLFFRDDILSNKISFKNTTAKEFVNDIKNLHNDRQNDIYIITAMDGETFGHHIKNYENTFLKKVLDMVSNEDEIQISFISTLDSKFPICDQKIIPKRSSWSTTGDDFAKGIFYPLWDNPYNKVHTYYWKMLRSLAQLMDLADKLDLTGNWEAINYRTTARWFYDKSFCSDTTWWANPPNLWSPNMIYKGIILLMKAALNAHLALLKANVKKAEGYFDAISYYHGLILMEISSMSQPPKKALEKEFNNDKL